MELAGFPGISCNGPFFLSFVSLGPLWGPVEGVALIPLGGFTLIMATATLGGGQGGQQAAEALVASEGRDRSSGEEPPPPPWGTEEVEGGGG